MLSFKKEEVNFHSAYAMMPNGPMKEGSLGRLLLHELLHAYWSKYPDKADKEAVLSAIMANYQIQVDQAWQAFLAEIGFDE
jgi:hypothetical protein